MGEWWPRVKEPDREAVGMWTGLVSLHMKGLLAGKLFTICGDWLQNQRSPRCQSIRNTENNEA